MGLGIGGEVGEVLNEIKKLERDDNNILTKERKLKIMTELGDVMWYLSGICSRIDCSIEDIVKNNMSILIFRQFFIGWHIFFKNRMVKMFS